MPRKVNALDVLFVARPDSERGKKLVENFRLLATSSLGFSANDRRSLRKRDILISVRTFLETYRPIKSSFVVLTDFVGGITLIENIRSPKQLDAINEAVAGSKPVPFLGGWLLGLQLWEPTPAEECCSEEELKLLLLEAADKDRQKFERLRHKFSGVPKGETKREPIPEAVRIFVWRRDDGRCVRCGSNERLEYDHIIPRSRGGSNTERNIQLLCERCNREKSNSI